MTRPLHLHWNVNSIDVGTGDGPVVSFTLAPGAGESGRLIAEIARKIQALQVAGLSDDVFKKAVQDIMVDYRDKAAHDNIPLYEYAFLPFAFEVEITNKPTETAPKKSQSGVKSGVKLGVFPAGNIALLTGRPSCRYRHRGEKS